MAGLGTVWLQPPASSGLNLGSAKGRELQASGESLFSGPLLPHLSSGALTALGARGCRVEPMRWMCVVLHTPLVLYH